MSDRTQTDPIIWERGVWIAPFRDQAGHGMQVAIDSEGRLVCVASFKEDDRRRVAENLWRLLDRVDPRPTLSAL